MTPTPRRRLIKADLTLRLSTNSDDDEEDMKFYSFSSRDHGKVTQEKLPASSSSSTSTSSGGGEVFGSQIKKEDYPETGSSLMTGDDGKDQSKSSSSHPSSGVKRKFSFKSSKYCFNLLQSLSSSTSDLFSSFLP